METESVDLAVALHWVGGDRRLLGELVGVFVEEAPARLAELRQAVRTQDAATLERVAHTLKGSAGLLGAQSLRTASGMVEERAIGKRLEGTPDLVAGIERELARVLAFFGDPAWRTGLDRKAAT
jgi:HPt (histidine-containing phosphotransfer) domain-containing protein